MDLLRIEYFFYTNFTKDISCISQPRFVFHRTHEGSQALFWLSPSFIKKTPQKVSRDCPRKSNKVVRIVELPPLKKALIGNVLVVHSHGAFSIFSVYLIQPKLN
jgi:hypothetical protein